MELNRKDYVYLKLLYKRKCTSFFQSLTLAEIMDVTGTAKVTTYRNLQKLCKHEYIKKACKSGLADTYMLLPKGIEVVEREADKHVEE